MEETITIKTDAEAVVPQEEVKVLTPTIEDLEAKNQALEAEKARLISDRDNYKVALLKEKSKKVENLEDESDDDRIRRISREELANSRLAEIAQEQDVIITKALKENKELKLAQLNKTTTPPAGMGTHTESIKPTDTSITAEQLAYFKAPKPQGMGWTDTEIESYKKNSRRLGR